MLAGRELDQIPGPVTLAEGDAVTLESPGGGGMGPAAKRDPARLRRDRALGYVTDASAYGAD